MLGRNAFEDVMDDDDHFVSSSRAIREQFTRTDRCGRKEWIVCGATSASLGLGTILLAIGSALLVSWHHEPNDPRDAAIAQYNAAVSRWDNGARAQFNEAPNVKVVAGDNVTTWPLHRVSDGSETPTAKDHGTIADALKPKAYSPLDFQSPMFVAAHIGPADCYCSRDGRPDDEAEEEAAAALLLQQQRLAKVKRTHAPLLRSIAGRLASVNRRRRLAVCPCTGLPLGDGTCNFNTATAYPHIGYCDGYGKARFLHHCGCLGCLNATVCADSPPPAPAPTPTPPVPTPPSPSPPASKCPCGKPTNCDINPSAKWPKEATCSNDASKCSCDGCYIEKECGPVPPGPTPPVPTPPTPTPPAPVPPTPSPTTPSPT